MEELADRNHLLCRQGIYYYHRRVPDHLVAQLGKAVIKQSLKTKDLKQAQRSRNVLDVRWDAEFARRSGEPAKDDATICRATRSSAKIANFDAWDVAREYLHAELQRFHMEMSQGGPSTVEHSASMQAEKTWEIDHLKTPGDPEADELIGRAFGKVFPDAPPDEQRSVLAEIVRRTLLEIAQRKLCHLEYDFSEPQFDQQLAVPRKVQVPTFGDIALRFQEFEIEKAEISSRKEAWRQKIRSHISLLLELVGPDVPITDIDYTCCRSLQSTLARMPANRTRSYRNLSVEDAINKCAADGRRVLSPDSQARYLDFFRSILDLALKMRLIPNNPADGLQPLKQEAKSDAEKRPAFDPSQIATFFASTFYQQWKPGTGKPYKKKDRDWRFWLPLFAAFMGMRPNEICQLRVGSVKTTPGGVLFVHVTDEVEAEQDYQQSLKTVQSRRRIPVHPALLQVGFARFFETRARHGKNALLFSDLKAGKDGYYSEYAMKRFRETFLPEAIDLQPGQVFYSFRHSFRDALRRMDAPQDVLSALGGWSEGKRVSDNYGDKGSPDYLFKYLSMVSYPGVELDFSYASLP